MEHYLLQSLLKNWRGSERVWIECIQETKTRTGGPRAVRCRSCGWYLRGHALCRNQNPHDNLFRRSLPNPSAYVQWDLRNTNERIVWRIVQLGRFLGRPTRSDNPSFQVFRVWSQVLLTWLWISRIQHSRRPTPPG